MIRANGGLFNDKGKPIQFTSNKEIAENKINKVKTFFKKPVIDKMAVERKLNAKTTITNMSDDKSVYYRDANGVLLKAFSLSDVKEGKLFLLQQNEETGSNHVYPFTLESLSWKAVIGEIHQLWIIDNFSKIPKKAAMTSTLLKSLGREIVAKDQTIYWLNDKGDQLNFTSIADKLTNSKLGKGVKKGLGKFKFKNPFAKKPKVDENDESVTEGEENKAKGSWKDRAKAMLSGAGGKISEGVKSRIGSWQWKREQKEKDSWIGKLVDAFNKGRNFGRKPDDGKKF